MSRLWLNDGALVMSGNVLCLDSSCPCGTGTDYSYCTRNCDNNEAPNEFEITISGTNFYPGSGPTDYDGTWVFPWDTEGPSFCYWREYWVDLNGNPQSISGPWIALGSAGPANVAIDFYACNNVAYSNTFSSDCLAIDGTLNMQSAGMECNEGDGINWPSSVSIKARLT